MNQMMSGISAIVKGIHENYFYYSIRIGIVC